MNKSDLLTVCIDELAKSGKDIDVICISERNMICGDECCLNIPNYNLASICTRSNRHGGSCILIKKTLKYKEIENISKMSHIGIVEISGIEIMDQQLFILCVYRPPKSNPLLFDIFF